MFEAFNGILRRFGVSDVVQVSPGLALHAPEEVVQHVDGLVNPAALLERSRNDRSQCGPEAKDAHSCVGVITSLCSARRTGDG